jgi:hypothetical protein
MSKIGEITIEQEVIWLSRIGMNMCKVLEIRELEKPYVEHGIGEEVDFVFKIETNEVMEHSGDFYLPHQRKLTLASIQLNPSIDFQNINWSGGPGGRGFVFSSEEKFKEWKKELQELNRTKIKNQYNNIMRDKELNSYEALNLLGVY